MMVEKVMRVDKVKIVQEVMRVIKNDDGRKSHKGQISQER